MDEPITWADLPQFMADIRAMARGLLAHEGHAASLQTTALVLTALRRQRRADQDWDDVTWANRRYLFGALYQAMERALIDHARRRAAQQRAMGTPRYLEPLQWQHLPHLLEEQPAHVLLVLEALAQLAQTQPQWAEMVRHRYYSGLTIAETARLMGVGEKTVRRWWERARLLLHDEIRRHGAAEAR